MNTRPHCSKSPPTGIGGQPMPGSITANWRIRSAASLPNAGFRIRRKSCSISPGDTIPEPIVSVADLLPDDRRDARVGLLGDPRAACAYDAAANHQALAPSALVVRPPPSSSNNHIGRAVAAFRATQPRMPIDDRRLGTVPLGLLSGVGLDLMAAISAPYDQANAGRRRAA